MAVLDIVGRASFGNDSAMVRWEELELHDEILAAFNPAGASELLDVAFQHRISLVANALGTPPPSLVARGKAAGVVVVAALVGQAKHARRQLDAGVDLLIAQGTEAGGHTGEIASMVLTPDIVDAVGPDVPVLGAGGIGSGRQIAASLSLGAQGVWTGSIWLGTEEYRNLASNKGWETAFLRATSADTVRTRIYTGKPARLLKTKWTEAWTSEDAPEPLPMPCGGVPAGAAR